MDQFKALFGSSRQPTLNDADDVHVYSDSSHVLVMCRNQLYYFSALWPGSNNLAVDEADSKLSSDYLHVVPFFA